MSGTLAGLQVTGIQGWPGKSEVYPYYIVRKTDKIYDYERLPIIWRYTTFCYRRTSYTAAINDILMSFIA